MFTITKPIGIYIIYVLKFRLYLGIAGYYNSPILNSNRILSNSAVSFDHPCNGKVSLHLTVTAEYLRSYQTHV